MISIFVCKQALACIDNAKVQTFGLEMVFISCAQVYHDPRKNSQILFQKLRLSHDLESQKQSILGNCWQGPKILRLLSFCLIGFPVSLLMFLVIQAQYLVVPKWICSRMTHCLLIIVSQRYIPRSLFLPRLKYQTIGK